MAHYSYASGLYMSESDGPDKLKNTYACYLHHNGVRTFSPSQGFNATGTKIPITDYSCCCDPCRYRRSAFGKVAGQELDFHCCACNPEIIVANYIPDLLASDSSGCCVNQIEPMFLNFTPVSSGGSEAAPLAATYQTVIVENPIKTYLSKYPVNLDGSPRETGVGGSSSLGCYWVVQMTGTSTNETVTVDHTGVTCLGVPDIEITNFPANSGCLGAVTLSNFEIAKVPFTRRADRFDSPLPHISGVRVNNSSIAGWHATPSLWKEYPFGDAGSGLLIPIPSGQVSPPTIVHGTYVGNEQYPTGIIHVERAFDQVPRFLCVKNALNGTPNLKEFYLAGTYPNLSNRSPFTIDLSADTGSIFFPYEFAEGHPVYTGVISTGVYLARWEYIPLSGYYTAIGSPSIEPQREEIYLVETWRNAITEFSGDADAARVSGSPQYELRVDFETPYWHSFTPAVPKIRHPIFMHPDTTDDPFYPPDPGSLNIGHGEYFFPGTGVDGTNTENLDVTKFGCDFYSHAAFWSSDNSVIRTCEVRPGRCACWKYYCSDACRCVPEKLCYYAFVSVSGSPEDTQYFTQGRLNWNPKEKSWIDNDTGGTGSGVAIYLKESQEGFNSDIAAETYTGFCEAGLSGDYIDSFNFKKGWEFGNPIKAPTCQSIMTFSFDGSSADNKNHFSLYAYPSFGDHTDCERLICSVPPIASPCSADCGSHPQSLLFEAIGYEAEVEVGTPRTCSYRLNLEYFQHIRFIEGSPPTLEVKCGYKGLDGRGGQINYKGTENQFYTFLDSIFEDSSNSWNMTPSGEQSPNEGWVLNQSCDPYEAILYIDYGGPVDFPFSHSLTNSNSEGLCKFLIDVIEITITES